MKLIDKGQPGLSQESHKASDMKMEVDNYFGRKD